MHATASFSMKKMSHLIESLHLIAVEHLRGLAVSWDKRHGSKTNMLHVNTQDTVMSLQAAQPYRLYSNNSNLQNTQETKYKINE